MARTTAYGHLGLMFGLGGVISALTASTTGSSGVFYQGGAGLLWIAGLVCVVWALASSPPNT